MSSLTNSACSVFPSEAGLRSTITPAASRAAILESAPPLPPLTMAPGTVSTWKGRDVCTELTGVAHSSSGWRRDTCDETYNWLLSSIILFQEVGCIFLSRASNLADHDDAIGLFIFQEDLQAIDEVGTRKWVSSNSHHQRLTEAGLCRLVDSLICESSRPRDNTNAAALVDEARHDTDFALSWGDNAGAVGSDQTCLSLRLQHIGNSNHV
jgi:hypothetical protein